MLKKFLALAAAGVVLTGIVFAADTTPAPATITDVHVCPITMEVVKGKGAGSALVGNTRVFFCCGGCPEQFAKLSKEDQEKKAAAALKKQQDAAKPA